MTTQRDDLSNVEDVIDGADQRPAPRRSAALLVLTASEAQTWRDCPQKHHFKYRLRLRTKVDAPALAIGSILHSGMSSGLRAGWSGVDGLSVAQRVERQVAAAQAGIDALVMKWTAKLIEHTRVTDYDELAEDAAATSAMVKWMLGHYFAATSGDLTSLILVETERAFSVPLRDIKGRPVKHLRSEGVRDAVFYDPTYNALDLHEHKSVGATPRDLERRAEMDPQTTTYINSLFEDLAQGRLKLVTGEPVPRDAKIGRLNYNALKKKIPSTPKVNQDGTVSIAAIDTLPRLYVEALDEQSRAPEHGGRGIPVTEKQYAKAKELADKGDTFFARVEYFRTQAELERWRVEAFMDASRIREANRNALARTRNPGHCTMPWSMRCEYRQLCLDPESTELASQFRISRDIHAEVREAEADADSPA